MDRTTDPDWEAEPLFCKGTPPRGPGNTCTCNGCWFCTRQYNDNLPNPDVHYSAEGGHVTDCTCDIDWECLYGRHERVCFTYDRR